MHDGWCEQWLGTMNLVSQYPMLYHYSRCGRRSRFLGSSLGGKSEGRDALTGSRDGDNLMEETCGVRKGSKVGNVRARICMSGWGRVMAEDGRRTWLVCGTGGGDGSVRQDCECGEGEPTLICCASSHRLNKASSAV